MTPQERKNFESIRDNVHGEPMTQVETMKLALDALDMVKTNADDWQERTGKEIKGWMQPVNNSITALRQAIEQAQKQEPAIFLKEWSDWRDMVVANIMRHGSIDKHLARQLANHFQGMIPQQKQEPVGFICQGNVYMADDVDEYCTATHIPLYTKEQL